MDRKKVRYPGLSWRFQQGERTTRTMGKMGKCGRWKTTSYSTAYPGDCASVPMPLLMLMSFAYLSFASCKFSDFR